MQLIYKIEFNTTNQYFKHIIEDLIKEATVNATCKQYKGVILLTLDEEPEVIESFFATLGNKLPVSIFMGNSYVVESVDESLEELEPPKLVYELTEKEWRLLCADHERRGKFLVLIEQDIYDCGIDTQKFPKADSFLNLLFRGRGEEFPPLMNF